MLKHIIAIAFSFGILGCSATSGESDVSDIPIAPSPQNVQSGTGSVDALAKLQALPIESGQDVEITLTNKSQRLKAFGIDSPVAVYRISGHNKVLQLDIKSYYNSTLFAPSVLILGPNGEKVAAIPNTEFRYEAPEPAPERTHEQKVSKKILTTQATPDTLYVIVYTTKEDAKGVGHIRIKHKYGQYDRSVEIPHATTGRVSLTYKTLGKSDEVILLDSDNSLDIKTADYETPRQQLFLSLRKAIQEKDTHKALQLLDELEAL